MKIINQCLRNCYDQQLICTYRDYYGIKAQALIIPPCQHPHSLPQYPRLQLSIRQRSNPEDGDSPSEQTSWPSHYGPRTSVISYPRGCSGVIDPARLC